MASAASEIRLWHSMEGVRGAELARLVAQFNASQKNYRVVAAYKGAYDEALVEAVTARNTPRAPHIVQASDLGAAYLLEQEGLVRPLWQLLDLKLESMIGGAEQLRDAHGRLLALPFGVSTPVLYYNRDAFRRASLDPARPPATWYEMAAMAAALVETGTPCAFTTAERSALLENLSAWHNEAFATDTSLVFNRRLTVRWVSMLATWMKSGYFSYAARGSEAEARFAAGECALLAASSASHAELVKRSDFDLGVAQLPYYEDFDGAPRHTLSSGAGLWVMAGRPKSDYVGVARFLAFFTRPEVQAQWHQRTGLFPLTLAAYELSQKQGFYKTHPGNQIALLQVLAHGGNGWQGARLARYPALRAIIDEELGSAWTGKKGALEAVNSAVARGNALLERLAPR
jgi:sn-glycerol 3-phosphate transport system substrate-binding protein